MELTREFLTEKMARLLNFRTRRRILSYVIILLVVSYCITLFARMRCTEVYRNTKKRISRYIFHVPDDISCYRQNNPTDEGLKFIKSNSIYIISASCDSFLSAHHACAIESVMQAHGYEKNVYVFFTKPVKECICSQGLIKGLINIPLLHFITIQIDKFVEDTPFRDIFSEEFLKIGLDREARVIEYLKFAALYKFKGTVIDLNLIMAKPVYYLGLNWGVRVNSSRLGTAAVALNRNTPIGKSLLKRTMELLKEQRNNDEIDGGLSLTDAFRQLCYNKPALGCPSFTMYDSELCYPFNRSSSDMIFQRGDLLPKSFGYYIWDRTATRLRRGSVYNKLMREYCPNIASYLNV